MSSSATASAAAGTAAAAPSTSGTSTRRSGGALQPQPQPSPSPAAAAASPLRLLVDRWDAARAVTTQLDACMRADQQTAGEAQVAAAPPTSTGAATAAAATAATASASSSAPAPSVTLYRRYRITLLLECGPSLLATLQPGSARILSQMLGCACRRALAQLHHAATKVSSTAHTTTRPRSVAQARRAIRPAVQMHQRSLTSPRALSARFSCCAVRPHDLRDGCVRVRGRSSQRAAVLSRAGQQLPIGKRRPDQRRAVADTRGSGSNRERQGDDSCR